MFKDLQFTRWANYDVMNGLSHLARSFAAIAATLLIALIGVASIIGSGEGTGSGITCCGFTVSTVDTTEPVTNGPTQPVNQRPTARAGPDQFVIVGSIVTLSDSSSDPDGQISSATWSQESGPIVTLQGQTFVAPMVAMRTELRFGLVVQDAFGAQGFDDVTITVDPDPTITLIDGFIDFERLPNGELTTDFAEIGSDYANGCVVFRNFVTTDISKGPEYRRIEHTNNTLAWDNDRTFNPPPGTNFNITADFSVAVSTIEADVFADVGESITMTALDSSGGALGTVTSVNSTACCSGATDTIVLSGIGDIATVTWETSAPKATVPRIDNLHFERIRACGVSECPVAADFDYADVFSGQNSTLTASIQNSPPSNDVTVNGADSAAPNIPFTFDWGDSTETTGWFPQDHTYADASNNYIITVTAHYSDGTASEVFLLARFKPPLTVKVIDAPALAVTIPSQDINLGTRLYNPPMLSHFDDSLFGQVPRDTVEYVLTVAADLQYEQMNRDVFLLNDAFNQVVLLDPNLGGGMYSLWYTNPVAFGAGPAAFSGTLPYSSFFHEMGHNVTLNTPADHYYGGRIDGHANAIYSETMAQIVAHVTAYDIIRQGAALGLSCDLIFDIGQDALRTARFIGQQYNNYVGNGMPFASWNDPATSPDETFGTFMTLAYVFLNHAQSGGEGFSPPLKRMMTLLQNTDNVNLIQSVQTINSPGADVIRVTLMVAAISYAFSEDLSAEFQALNFPVDNALHDQLYNAAP